MVYWCDLEATQGRLVVEKQHSRSLLSEHRLSDRCVAIQLRGQKSCTVEIGRLSSLRIYREGYLYS